MVKWIAAKKIWNSKPGKMKMNMQNMRGAGGNLAHADVYEYVGYLWIPMDEMTAYRLEMKLYHTVSCRYELVRDAHHAGQRSGNMDTYRYNTYRVFRADK